MDRARVLVVEDEGVVALEIQHRLKALGYQVAGTAASGEQAVEAAARVNPDLILMDIRLQGNMDGLQAAALIRSHRDIPIVFATANSDDGIVQQIKLTEPYGYVVKPFQEDELRVAIEIALHKHAADRRLRESERWLAATLQSIGDAAIATDPSGRVKHVNRVAEALTGWRQERALGRDLAEVFRLADERSLEPVEDPVAEAIATAQTVLLKPGVELVASGGQRLPVEANAAPIIGPDGRVIGAILVFRDITERRQAEDRLQQYARELETRNDDLDSFAHTLAHGVTSTLLLIEAPAELLETYWAEMSPEERGQHLQMIRKNSRKMKDIMEELLLLAQVREQEVEPAAMTDMAEVVDRALARLAYPINEARAEIVLPESWPVALGYGPWVEEIWVNYIGNAIKYGGKPPRVELGAAVQADGRAHFWVRDNGGGIAPEAQAALFAPLARLARMRVTGHGLGLSIVKRIADRLGGDVGVESRPGEGSTFRFVLPAPPPDPWDEQSEAQPAGEPGAIRAAGEIQERGR